MTRALLRALTLAALGIGAVLVVSTSADEPVRVGVLTIRSGPIASCGRQMEEGFQFALKERGGALAGRKVEAFWKYEPAAFLAAPVYSRDYPPAKNLE